ncbi:MAG: aminodeoxychorismate/anthranilate synthase component II [Phycisphaerales bacterium]|nr:aminodeoxychorismate/anthranilate synthase component II [Phycisphaerales bacterium]
MLLLLDNYDSFTWNLVHLIGVVAPGLQVAVHRNDALDVDAIEAMGPEAIVISPGPCTPTETGICRDVIRAMGGTVPMLGVCLGHQAMADVNGIAVARHDRPVHGRTSTITHDGQGVFAGLPDRIQVARYHSLIVPAKEIRLPLQASATTDEGEVMAMRLVDSAAPMVGLQFHPESFLTPTGGRLMANFLTMAGIEVDQSAIPCPAGVMPTNE